MNVALIIISVLLVKHCTAVWETPLQSDSALDHWCIATHFGASGSTYDTKKDVVMNLMLQTGFRSYRVEFWDNATILWAAPYGVKTIALIPVSSTTTTQDVLNWVKVVAGVSQYIDCIEGPNEPNGMWDLNGWRYNGDDYKTGLIPMVTDLWKAVKSTPILANIPVLAPAWSQGSTDPVSAGFDNQVLRDLCTWGNWHPYPTNNCFAPPFVYDNLTDYFCKGNDPINTDALDYAPNPYLYYQEIIPLFGPNKTLAVTETGYPTVAGGVSERVQGKYIPRLLLESIRMGYERMCIYQLIDGVTVPNPSDVEANFGMYRYDLSPKPSANAMRGLSSILTDKGPNFTTTPLNYTISVTPVGDFTETSFVHHLLFQKRNGDYLIVVWHEINLNDKTVSPYIELFPPDLPIQVTFGTSMTSSGVVYSWDADSGNMTSSSLNLTNGGTRFESAAQDRVRIFQVSPTEPKVTTASHHYPVTIICC